MSSNGTREITYLEALREAMSQEMRRDPSVFLIGEDIGTYGGAFGVSMGMLQEFGPERVIDTPIAESALTGISVGAAMMGMRPILEIMFFDFLTLCSTQLVHHAAKNRYMFGGKVSVPMVLRSPAGSGTGAAAQHSSCFENWFVGVPGLKVVAPATAEDAKGMLVSAIRDNNAVVFMEHKLLYRTKGPVRQDLYTTPFGKARIARQGKDLTIFAYSIMVSRSLEAAALLEKEGIDVEVVDLRSLRPLDYDTIHESVTKTGRALLVTEASTIGSFSGELAAVIASGPSFDRLDAPIMRLGGKECPIPYNRALERVSVPQVEDITAAARKLAGGGE
jgi:acetoin:2,6-dichlorophenolindophenol oxidoreductase subunit beta